MTLMHTVPLLLSILVGLLLGLVTWGFFRIRRHITDGDQVETRDDILLGLLAFAVFSVGAFITYILLLVWAR
jgi:hypothetical protein